MHNTPRSIKHLINQRRQIRNTRTLRRRDIKRTPLPRRLRIPIIDPVLEINMDDLAAAETDRLCGMVDGVGVG